MQALRIQIGTGSGSDPDALRLPNSSDSRRIPNRFRLPAQPAHMVFQADPLPGMQGVTRYCDFNLAEHWGIDGGDPGPRNLDVQRHRHIACGLSASAGALKPKRSLERYFVQLTWTRLHGTDFPDRGFGEVCVAGSSVSRRLYAQVDHFRIADDLDGTQLQKTTLTALSAEHFPIER